MFFTRMGLTKVLGLAVLGTAGLFGANSAQAGGFRFSLGIAPVVYAQPAYIVQQPVCPAPAPVYYAAPVQQQVIFAPAPVCTTPVVIYDRDGWRHDRHEFIERHERHDEGFRHDFRR